jgi:hypothetical protein
LIESPRALKLIFSTDDTCKGFETDKVSRSGLCRASKSSEDHLIDAAGSFRFISNSTSLLGRITTHQQNSLEFYLAAEKHVEEIAELDNGEDGIVGGGGRQKIGEAV